MNHSLGIRRVCAILPISVAAGLALAPVIVMGAGSNIGLVRSIHRGLSVQPNGEQSQPGHVKQSLHGADRLQTIVNQQASLGFSDGSVLAMNQRTDLVLQSSGLTVVRGGEVAATDAPGSHHRIQTNNATASAVGTLFDVRIAGQSGGAYPGQTGAFPPGTTTVSVATGVVSVSNNLGHVKVLAGEWTHVRPGKAPTAPTRHNARGDVSWTGSLLPH